MGPLFWLMGRRVVDDGEVVGMGINDWCGEGGCIVSG